MTRPLFVVGASRSGTTALTNYVNQHEEILVCIERYKRVYDRMDASFFTFRRILDYEPRREGGETNIARERHLELLARKDPNRLKWIGDKQGAQAKRFRAISENNPGAHFLITYRPVEEVVESFEERARESSSPVFAGKDGLKLGVEAWNRALRSSREYLETFEEPNGLVVSYHDFFGGFEDYVPLLSEFLELDFDDSILDVWRETSREFEGSRRKKEPITEGKAAYIEQNKDHGAEAWMLERVARQWTEPGLYKPAAGRGRGRPGHVLRCGQRAGRLAEELGAVSARLAAAEEERRRLEERMGEVRRSRGYRVLRGVGRVRSAISRLVKR